MALRVLLADESVTIKKVIQLALQDFAVEVKAVPVGLDVLEVSKSFQPDLVFADILLQKRSGYEVCTDLKKDTATAAIPVVLMWSSFMELDQRQVDACGADGRLEKPFEVEALRKLVLELVPRTRSQRMAHFLEYPASIAAPLKQEVKPAPPPPAAPSVKPAAPVEEITAVRRKVPTSNPFVSSLGPSTKVPESSIPTATMTPGSLEFTHTPMIPERPKAVEPPTQTTAQASAPVEEPLLGALPDLQLEGQAGANTSRASSGGWNMESFEPLDLAPLTMADDDDDEDESFKPLQLPQNEPTRNQVSGPELSLADPIEDSDGEDSDADQWANQSLDKYRLAPLKPEESLALDDNSTELVSESQTLKPPPPQERSRGRFEFDQKESLDLATDKTEIIAPTQPRKRPVQPPPPEEALPEFSMSDDDFNRTSRLEIENVEQRDKTRPSIVRELLREPDFTKSARTTVHEDGEFDLGSAGTPAKESVDSRKMEELVRSQLTPQLEKAIESAIERSVAKLLPQIAERIIKKELERLLDET